MNIKHVNAFCFLLGCAALALAQTPIAGKRNGDWTIRSSETPGAVQFTLMDSRKDHQSNHSSEWPVADMHGLDTTKPGHQEVHFAINRDAGNFDCSGFLDSGEGAGVFHFAPDGKYPQQMAALVFSGVDADKQFAMAVFDVTLKFAQEMKDEHLRGLDTDKLIAFKIFGVTPQFIHDIRAAGLEASDSDKLVAYRIHGVSPEFVRDIRAAGINISDGDKFIAFRIHGVSPEMVRALHAAGYQADADKLIAMRI